MLANQIVKGIALRDPRVGSSASRFAFLDVLRGMAASLVVLHHIPASKVGVGHDAVMVFFVISGYCMTAALQRGVVRAETWRCFALRRVRRIFPPYAASLVMACLLLGTKSILGFAPWKPSFAILVLNGSLTQWLWLILHPMPLASLNPTLILSPYWSLGYEEQFYVVMGVFLCITRTSIKKLLKIVCALTLCSLCWNLSFKDHRCFGIFLDYWAHFSIGIGVFVYLRVLDSRRDRMVLLCTMSLSFALAVLLASPSMGSAINLSNRSLPREYAVTLGTGLMLIVLSRFDQISSMWVVRPFVGLGTISYSLYLVHYGWLGIVDRFARGIIGLPSGTTLLVVFEFVLHVLLAATFWYLWERRFVSTSSMKPRSPVVVAAGRNEQSQ